MKFQQFDRYTYVKEKHKTYLEELEAFVQTSSYLPAYHLYPKSGLMNDPNGLAYFNHTYYFFYQWFPFEPTHGMKHWGLSTSKNLVDWQDEGLALIPNQEYEKNGCYSGGSIEKDGFLYLFYTANYKTPNGKIPKQALAIMGKDGKIQKSTKNPIIDSTPEGMSGEIRDPFIFEREGHYFMLLGAKDQNNVGQLLLYKSSNLMDWNYQGVIELPVNKGYMVECPALIEVDGKDVLLFSPMGLEKEERRYQNQFATTYLVGELDLNNKVFHLEHSDEVDSGFDFYAPQVFYGKDRVPMMVAWFGCGEQKLPSDKDMWKHGLTIPYTLALKNNRLTHFVVPELAAQFKQKQSFDAETIQSTSNAFHIQFTLENEGAERTIRFGSPDDYWELLIDFGQNLMAVDRSHLALPVDIENGEIRKTNGLNKDKYQVDIFVDNSFVEIFLDQGEKSFAFRTFNMATDKICIQFDSKVSGVMANYDIRNK